MIRGLYSAASGMFAMERKQEALAHNLANAQTPGYKKDDTVMRAFPNLLIQRIHDFDQNANVPAGMPQLQGNRTIGELSNGVYAQERIPSFQQGPLVETARTLDVALEDQSLPVQGNVKPAAFFAVQLQDGTVGYTRNGKWDLDANGTVVTAEGYRVLGANGEPLQVNTSLARENLQINGNGQLLARDVGVIGEIGIAVVENPHELRRIGGNVYVADNPAALGTAGETAGVALHQGFIEQSNVDAGQTITEMMTAIRSYEANQKVINVYDQSLQQLYTVGKMNG